MKNIDVVASKNRLDHLFSKLGGMNHDVELQSHWSSYLCILVSGFVEVSVRALIADYVENKSHPHVAKFVARQLQDFQNPKMAKILTLVGCFSRDWEDAIKAATDGKLKDAVDSIVANRCHISHGRSVNIGLVTVRDYYQRVLEVIELIEAKLSP